MKFRMLSLALFACMLVLAGSQTVAQEGKSESSMSAPNLGSALSELRARLSELAKRMMEANKVKDRQLTAQLIDEHRRLSAVVARLSSFLDKRSDTRKQDSSEINWLAEEYARAASRLEELHSTPELDPDGELARSQSDYVQSLANEILRLGGTVPGGGNTNPLGGDAEYQAQQRALREAEDQRIREAATRARRAEGIADAYFADLPTTGDEQIDRLADELRQAQNALANHALDFRDEWTREQAVIWDGARRELVRDAQQAERSLIEQLARPPNAQELEFLTDANSRTEAAEVPLAEAAEIAEDVRELEHRHQELRAVVEALQQVGGVGLRGASFGAALAQAAYQHEQEVGRYNEARNRVTAELWAARQLREFVDRSTVRRGIDAARSRGTVLQVDREIGSAEFESLLHIGDVSEFRRAGLLRSRAFEQERAE